MVSKLLRHMKHYSSDITDNQWMLLQGILRDSRERKHSLWNIFNAIFYISGSNGCTETIFKSIGCNKDVNHMIIMIILQLKLIG